MDDGTAGGSAGATRKRSLRWWIIGAVAVVVVLAVGGPFVYIHLIEGPAPGQLALPGSSTGSTGSSGSSGSAGATSGSVAGTWKVGPGSVVGYRVQEVLIGQNATAVGRTTKVSGTVTIDGTTVTAATVTVDMASVTSDQSERNAQFDGRIMDVAMYPTATLHLTQPLSLGAVPAPGHRASYSGTGTLTMHGVTRTIPLPLSAERTGDRYRRAGRDPHHLRRLEHRQPQHRRVRHHILGRDPRGAAASHPGRRQCGRHQRQLLGVVRVGRRTRGPDHGSFHHRAPTDHPLRRLTPAFGLTAEGHVS